MKKLIIAAAIIGTLGLGSTVAIAQGGDRMARMQQELGLTDDQVTKIKTLREAQRAEMEVDRKAHRQQIEALMTAEQKEKFSTMKGKGKRRMGKRGGRSGRGQCEGGKHQGGAAQQS